MIDPNGGAFPWQQFNSQLANTDGVGQGFTKRELACVMVLAGQAHMLGQPHHGCKTENRRIADSVVRLVDALFDELNAPPEEVKS